MMRLDDEIGRTHTWKITEELQKWTARECTTCGIWVYGNPTSQEVKPFPQPDTVWETCRDTQARQVQES
jgi:hypothetical protein